MKLPDEQGDPLAWAPKESEDGQLRNADMEDCTEVLADTGRMLPAEAEAITKAIANMVASGEIDFKPLELQKRSFLKTVRLFKSVF